MSTYQLDNVWHNKTDALRDEIITFWLHNHALPDEKTARERVGQIIFVARGQDGQILGVNSAVPIYSDHLGLNLFYYRVFVAPQYRQLEIGSALTIAACDFLNEQFQAGVMPHVVGILGVGESPYMQQVKDAVWRGYLVHIGRNQQGYPLRVFYFDGAQIM